MSKSNAYGHEIYYDEMSGIWRYSDTNESVNVVRECKHCGKSPTREGYDSCIGFLPNVEHACCGHRKSNPYAVLKDKKILDFESIEGMKKYFNIRDEKDNE